MLLKYLAPMAVCLSVAVPVLAETEAAPQSVAPATVAELPEEVEREIDEKTANLPDEIREKVREKIKEAAEAKLAEMKEAAEAAGEESSEEAATEEAAEGEEKAEGEEAAEEEKKEEPAEKDPQSEEVKKMKEEAALYDARFQHQVALYKHEIEAQRLAIEKSKIDLDLEAKRVAAQNAAIERERDRMKLETEVLKFQHELEMQKLAGELSKLEAEKKKIETELSVEAIKEKLEDRVIGDETYPLNPLEDGVLTVSVRRIELNGPISTGAADYVCSRIDYFNNQSDKPIFVVIDNCPGGSVMEGMQIVQAIKESKAPVHVVVKRFAASMAAIITTLADESYCYPDAIILHHQASTSMSGNGRDLEDQKRMFDEISRRMIGAVAEKIGTTQEKFVEDMYANSSSGDWDVFGDEAVERGWVKHVVKLVREEGIRERPTGSRSSGLRILQLEGQQTAPVTGYLERYEAPLVEAVDARGNSYVRLPKSGPFDAMLLYNPNDYYRY